jgi:hypothetical protein
MEYGQSNHKYINTYAGKFHRVSFGGVLVGRSFRGLSLCTPFAVKSILMAIGSLMILRMILSIHLSLA